MYGSILGTTPFAMRVVMTGTAEQDDVVRVKAKLWMRGPRLYVMKVKVRIGAARLADAISSENDAANLPPFSTCVESLPIGTVTTLPVRVRRASPPCHAVTLASQPRLRDARLLAQ